MSDTVCLTHHQKGAAVQLTMLYNNAPFWTLFNLNLKCRGIVAGLKGHFLDVERVL